LDSSTSAAAAKMDFDMTSARNQWSGNAATVSQALAKSMPRHAPHFTTLNFAARSITSLGAL
jgi:hypothetical protein